MAINRLVRYLLLVIVVFVALQTSGCATIVKDDSQPVAFSSDPPGATVSINNIPSGITPTTIMIRRSIKRKMIKYEMDGHHSVQFRLEKSLSGMTFGNLVFGGVVGAIVDVSSGKAMNYKDTVHVQMVPIRKMPVKQAETILQPVVEQSK